MSYGGGQIVPAVLVSLELPQPFCVSWRPLSAQKYKELNAFQPRLKLISVVWREAETTSETVSSYSPKKNPYLLSPGQQSWLPQTRKPLPGAVLELLPRAVTFPRAASKGKSMVCRCRRMRRIPSRYTWSLLKQPGKEGSVIRSLPQDKPYPPGCDGRKGPRDEQSQHWGLVLRSLHLGKEGKAVEPLTGTLTIP